MSKEKAAATPEVALKDNILALAKKIEAGIAMDKKSGIGTESGDLYTDNLPSNVTPELVKEISNYNADFITAGAYAFGKLAVEAMKGNKNLTVAKAEIAMGHRDSIAYNVQREKTIVNHLGDGATSIKMGVVTSAYDVRAGKKGSQMKIARQLISQMAADTLK